MNVPKTVEITEVGSRDGFQNLKDWIPIEQKLAVVEQLAAAGFTRIELRSFVHPKAVPQMADAVEILTTIKTKYAGRVKCIALVPNLFGAKRAIKLGADEITFVISASEAHNLANTKQTIEQSLAAFAEVCKIKGNTVVRLSIATAFTCPFAGNVPSENVLQIIEAGKRAGADEIMLADTIGTANPLQVETLLQLLIPKYGKDFVLHIHDTHGMGLANVLTCLQLGITRFETSVGGLGGCPFAPGAAGNIATEDLVNMLQGMGIDTGINLERLIAVAGEVRKFSPVPLSGHLQHAKTSKQCQG